MSIDNRVSIIIPSFNHEKYVIQTLESVLNDTYPNKEIVIVDDGSSDNSVEVIKNWIEENKDCIDIIFKHRYNKGISATCNELIKLATGKYIVILASDDLLFNNTIRQRVDILKQNPSKLVLISDAHVIDSEGRIVFESMMSDFHKADKSKYNSEVAIIDEIVFRFSFSGPALMVDKSIYNIVGEYPENLKAEDLYFYIKSACLRKVLFWDKKVSKYRWHSKNISDTNPRLIKTVLITYIKTFHLIPGIYRKVKVLKRIIGLTYAGIKHEIMPMR